MIQIFLKNDLYMFINKRLQKNNKNLNKIYKKNTLYIVISCINLSFFEFLIFFLLKFYFYSESF